jgi:lipopolysaccharide/colanic/teichoic acid biosynthesis glycosyltransferase
VQHDAEYSQRIESNIEHINNSSLWLDLTIMVGTLGVMIGKNACC